jgi:hypothetical protein
VPNARLTKEIETQNFSDEEMALFNDGAVFYIPGQYGKGTLSNNYLEKKLGISATMRNLNTLTKLVELSKVQDKLHISTPNADSSFTRVVKIMSETPPISNDEIVKRGKKQK